MSANLKKLLSLLAVAATANALGHYSSVESHMRHQMLSKAGAGRSSEDPGVSNDKRPLLTTRRHPRSDQHDLRGLQGSDSLGDEASPAKRVNAGQGRIDMISASSSWLSSALGFSRVAAKHSQEAISSYGDSAEDPHSTYQLDAGEPIKAGDNASSASNTKRSLERINKALVRIDMASKSLEPLEETLYARKPQYQETQDAWQHIKMARRHQWHPKSSRDRGMASFWSSAVFFEWVIFFTALPFFVMLHYHLIDWPSTKGYHALALFIWLLVAAIYATVIWVRLGAEAGITWTTGYILEFIFSIENIFVFHIVISAFKTPIKLTQRALFIVICCQIVFQMVFYMGLAHWLRSLEVLPYILGFWLLYVGVESAREENHGQINMKEMMGYRVFSRVLGNRLSPEYEEDGLLIFAVKGRFYVSLLAVVTACLLTVDFLLEIDVTLTKIEELDNEYLAFTSSVTAGFAMPELFFIARDLFRRYRLLQYGVSFALLLFGAEMVCQKLVAVPELLSCAAIFTVMVVLVALSAFTSIGESSPLTRQRSRAASGIWG